MKNLFVVATVAAGLALAGCTPVQQGAGIGAAGGAIIGGLATNTVGGAALGAAIGGVAGAFVGATVQAQPHLCYVTNANGQYLYVQSNGSWATGPSTTNPATSPC